MKIYLAARYSKWPQMMEFRTKLELLGHTVTSRWIDGHGPATFEDCTPEERARIASDDEADVLDSTCIIGFTEIRDTPTSGGRHCEWGMARALDLKQIMIGGRENVFYYMDGQLQFDTQEECLEYLRTGQIKNQNGDAQHGRTSDQSGVFGVSNAQAG